MANGLNDLTWDSGTSAAIVLGSTRVEFLKLSPGKTTVKVEKVRPIGSSIATKRTPGAAEVGDFGGEMEALTFERQILPRMPKHGGTLVTFPLLISLKHPSITGALSILLDRCRFIEWDGPELDGDGAEKKLVYKAQLSAMARFDRGSDGVWKALHYDPRRASSEARALMKF